MLRKLSEIFALRGLAMMICVSMLTGLVLGDVGCKRGAERSEAIKEVNGSKQLSVTELGGLQKFKVPVPKGYHWEVSQSWGEHCQICIDKGYTDWAYCSSEMSHTWDCCKYGIDFNLPGNADKGKPVLATADGNVKEASYSNGWGNYVVVDHGSDVCSRYAHLLEAATVSVGDPVCQGLVLGKIGTSGNSTGEHLHFQFESCSSAEGLPMGFTDGNGIPVCTRGDDVLDAEGNYNFLKLTNSLKNDCEPGEDLFLGDQLPKGGWSGQSCGSISGCPLRPNCDRSTDHVFADDYLMIQRTSKAAAYLYSECALDGKADGKLHPIDNITKAEALKIPMYLYGLMDECGVEMSFRDVDADDWFFPVVACALRYGIVNTVAEYFSPNEEIGFGEAAKYIVEAAARAGVVEIQDPPAGHFVHIPKGHWAYRYVETLYYYGGLVSNHWSRGADDKVERRGHVIMAAALSPCFCSNVACSAPCVCEQAVYACVDPREVSVGIGGDGADGGNAEDDGGSAAEDVPAESHDFELGIDCFVEVENVRCEGRETVLYIKCAIENRGEEVVRINNLVMQMTDESDADECQVTDADLRRGAGVNKVEAGERKQPSGHFEISCESPPEDGELEVVFDLVERVSGVVSRYPELLVDSVMAGPEAFEVCSGGVAAASDGDGPGDRRADGPGYLLHMLAQAGSFEVLTSGPGIHYRGEFQASVVLDLRFDAEELPTVVLLRGASDNLRIWRSGIVLPAFEVWADYRGPFRLNPPYRPDAIATSFAVTAEDKDIFIRIPPG